MSNRQFVVSFHGMPLIRESRDGEMKKRLTEEPINVDKRTDVGHHIEDLGGKDQRRGLRL